jgi:hypothetical protein
MTLDPFRLYRRHQRLLQEAQDEALHLRRRYGAEALEAARERLSRADVTTWGKRVMKRTVQLLQR